MSGRALPGACSEAELGVRWAAGLRTAARLEDGRSLKVVFPGVPGGPSGPDFRGAILDAGGDLLRGDVELHLLASGWRAHRHHLDAAYREVVLHVVAGNDTGALTTLHASGRAIPVLVLPPPAGQAAFPPRFTPPCALEAARGRAVSPALERLGLRRLRMKAAAAAPMVAKTGPGPALYSLTLAAIGGPANSAAFRSLASRLPLPALLERVEGNPYPRAAALAAELRGAAAGIALRRAGLRPMASPARRLEAAAALFAGWWPEGEGGGWPEALPPGAFPPKPLPVGLGRALAVETWVNAVLPVAFASRIWPEAACESTLRALPAPTVYGKLKRLDSWLGAGGERPFPSAARLQGGLLLHADYCTKGGCGRCPLSVPSPEF